MGKVKIFFVAALLLLSFSIGFGKSVAEPDVKNVAINWLNSFGQGHLNSSDILNIEQVFNGATIVYYVVSFRNTGWVLVSASDLVEPVLGYSLSTTFSNNNQPAQLQNWLNSISSQIKEAQTMRSFVPSKEIEEKWGNYISGKMPSRMVLKSAQLTSTSQLLATEWNQGRYYNELAPADASSSTGNGRVWIGCVATAMAQVMKYWSYPMSGMGSHQYYLPVYGTQSANFGNSAYNWATMPNKPSAVNDDLAKICYHAAVSVNMQFGPGGSGASLEDAKDAFVNFFRYNSTTLYSAKWSDESSWKTFIKNDIDKGRPVIYSGFDNSKNEGHAWVCDGYDGDYFHFNFGWGGVSNGFFLLSAINPNSKNYTYNQGAIVGIEPVTSSSLTLPHYVPFEASNSGGFSLTGVYGYSTSEKHSGNSSLLLSKPAFTSYSKSHASLAFQVPANSKISFWVKRKTQRNSANNQQRAKILTEHGTTVLISIFDGDYNDTDWKNYNIDLTAFAGQKVRLFFEQQNFDVSREQWMYIDDVTISGISENLAPFTPSNPVPSQSATEVPLDSPLQWSGGDPNGDSLSYSVYLGTSNTPPFVGTSNTNSFDPGKLISNVRYYWKIVSSDAKLTSESPVWSFNTQGIPPEMGLCGISNIIADSATICAETINDNNVFVSSRGVCWSIFPNPTTNNNNVTTTETTSQYTCTITGLEPYTTYYVRSFAVSNKGKGYSPQQTFVSAPAAPIISLKKATPLTRTTASLICSIDDINDKSIIRRGIVWSFNQGFKPEDGNKVEEIGDWNTLGIYEFIASGLDGPGKIYLRAFATNLAGTAYSNETELTLSNALPTIDLDANNSSGEFGNGFLGTVVENYGGGYISDSDVFVSDPDGDTLRQVRAILKLQVNNDEEFLIINTFNPYLNIVGIGTDTLTITANANISNTDWFDIIRKIELYVGVYSADNNINREVAVQVSDGFGFSNVALAYLEVLPKNQPPVFQSAPVLSQLPVVGELVKIEPGVWIDEVNNCSPTIQSSYKWLFRDASGNIDTIVGATEHSLLVDPKFCGGWIKGAETLTDNGCGATNTAFATAESDWHQVDKAAQSINFETIPSLSFSDSSFALKAFSNQNMPIVFQSSNQLVAKTEGDWLVPTGAGTTIITAWAEGNTCYLPSEKLSMPVTILKAEQQITSNLPLETTTATKKLYADFSTTSGLKINGISSSNSKVVKVEGDSLLIVAEGDAIITATINESDNYLAATNSFGLKVTRQVSAGNPPNGNFVIYPNPASGQVSINMNINLEKTIQVQITDLLGKTVLINEISEQYSSLDISKLKKGAYYIIVTGERVFVTEKLIVK